MTASSAATTGMAGAYSATARRWPAGPGRIYDVLATALVAHAPRSLHGALVVDVGAGTGAASRAATAAGARAVLAVDLASGMLAEAGPPRPVPVVGDACRLPLRTGSVDAVVAAFSFTHLADPGAGLAEAARVVRPGGGLVASAYADDDAHPVKDVVEQVLRAHGWTDDQWHADMRRRRAPLLASAAGCRAAVASVGLEATVHHLRIPFPHLDAEDLVTWRLGLAQYARFLTRLTDEERTSVCRDAVSRLGAAPPSLVRSILVTTAVA